MNERLYIMCKWGVMKKTLGNVVRASTKQEQGNKCVINLNILGGQVPNQRGFSN
jgi:hypothetical protein